MYMSEGVMTYPWSDFRRLLNRVTSIGPWICHNALRHIHGTKLFLKGKNDTCFFLSTRLIYTALESNPGLCGKNQATNSMS